MQPRGPSVFALKQADLTGIKVRTRTPASAGASKANELNRIFLYMEYGKAGRC